MGDEDRLALYFQRVSRTGLAAAPPHGPALELQRNRELGDLAYCVRHWFALSARFLGLSVISPMACHRLVGSSLPLGSMLMMPLSGRPH